MNAKTLSTFVLAGALIVGGAIVFNDTPTTVIAPGSNAEALTLEAF